MPTSYEPASKKLETLLEKAVKAQKRLVENKVRIGITVASSIKGVANRPACAKTNLLNAKWRLKLKLDVEIEIEADAIRDAKDRQITAIIEGELDRIDFTRNKKTNEIKVHDDGRPKLRLLDHDFVVWGSWKNIERYQEFSPAYRSLRFVTEKANEKQLLLFDNPGESEDDEDYKAENNQRTVPMASA